MSSVQKFLRHAIDEWHHVSWPTRHQAIVAAITALAVTAGAGIYLMLLDTGLRAAVDWLIFNIF